MIGISQIIQTTAIQNKKGAKSVGGWGLVVGGWEVGRAR